MPKLINLYIDLNSDCWTGPTFSTLAFWFIRDERNQLFFFLNKEEERVVYLFFFVLLLLLLLLRAWMWTQCTCRGLCSHWPRDVYVRLSQTPKTQNVRDCLSRQLPRRRLQLDFFLQEAKSVVRKRQADKLCVCERERVELLSLSVGHLRIIIIIIIII